MIAKNVQSGQGTPGPALGPTSASGPANFPLFHGCRFGSMAEVLTTAESALGSASVGEKADLKARTFQGSIPAGCTIDTIRKKLGANLPLLHRRLGISGAPRQAASKKGRHLGASPRISFCSRAAARRHLSGRHLTVWQPRPVRLPRFPWCR